MTAKPECPECAGPTVIWRQRDSGIEVLRCASFPRCAGTRELGCPACGAPMAVRPGRNGAFLGCTNYFDTECRGTREIIPVMDEPF